MKAISTLLFIFTVSLLLTSCNQDGSNAQLDRHPPLGIEEYEVTDKGYEQINQPGAVYFDENGENWDVDEDKETIKSAAERVPHVKVNSISIENRKANVYVSIDQAIGKTEELDWEENIKSAIQAIIPRYETEVIVEK